MMLAALLLAPMAIDLPAQTAEDAHLQHEHRLADEALNAQYRRTMAAMALADRTRQDELKTGVAKPDGRPPYVAALLAAERAWLTYRDAHCMTAGLAYRGGTYEDEAEGRCANDLTRQRTVALKQLADGMAR